MRPIHEPSDRLVTPLQALTRGKLPDPGIEVMCAGVLVAVLGPTCRSTTCTVEPGP